MIEGRGGFIAIFFRNLDLSLSVVGVLCGDHRPYAQPIDKFVHVWYRVRTLDVHYV